MASTLVDPTSPVIARRVESEPVTTRRAGGAADGGEIDDAVRTGEDVEGVGFGFVLVRRLSEPSVEVGPGALPMSGCGDPTGGSVAGE